MVMVNMVKSIHVHMPDAQICNNFTLQWAISYFFVFVFVVFELHTNFGTGALTDPKIRGAWAIFPGAQPTEQPRHNPGGG